MASYNIEAIFSAVTTPFSKGVNEVTRGISQLEKSTASTFQNLGAGMTTVGKAMTVGITLPLVAIGTLGVKAFTNIEDAMVGVRKTTEMSDKEFQTMTKSIMQMSKELPATAVEIAGVAESAGQLGIGKEHLLEFTRTMIDLGETTNLSAEEASMALARFANITGMASEDYSRLGSTVVELGNSFATSEAEIVNLGLRLSATGTMIGLTEAEILGLSAVMSSLGISAEAGGTAMSRVMQKINTAVSEGGTAVEKFAKVSGVSAEQFAKDWNDNPTKAISNFIEGLEKADIAGEDMVAILRELGITGQREVDVMQRLAQAGDETAKAFLKANGAWDENIALTKEAELRYETVTSKLEMAKNTITTAFYDIGKVVAPVLLEVADGISKIADKFTSLSPNTQDFIVKFGMILAVLGPIILVVGQFVSAIALIAPLFSPIGLAIAAVIAVLVLLALNWDKVTEAASNFMTYMGTVKDNFAEMFAGLAETARENIQVVKDFFTGLGESITENVAKFNEWCDGVNESVAKAWDTVKSKTSEAWESIKTNSQAGWDSIKTSVVTKATELKTGVQEKWENVKASTTEKWENVKSTVTEKMSGTLSSAKEKADSIKTNISTAWDNVKSATSSKFSEVKNSITTKLSESASTATQKAGEIKTNIGNALSQMVSTAGTHLNNFKTAVSNGIQGAVNSARQFISQAIGIGGQIINGFVQGVRNFADNLVRAVKGAVGNAISAAKSLLGIKSPSRVFADIGKNTMLGGERGIDKYANKPINAIKDMVGDMIKEYDNQMLEFGGIDNMGKIQTSMSHTLSDSRQNKEPALLTLVLGNKEYKGFVEDISNAQGREIRMVESYGY